MAKVRFIAYYLPQFYPIPENDEAWGKGFTEWTNVRKAKPLFKKHHQPFVPTELGYYDLRNPEVRKAQAQLAREHGIEGFCYWHYWMGNGKRLLELPFTEVVASGQPDFPFCLCWANHTWSKRWTGNERKIIVEQTYPGVEDYTAHFYALLPAFRDKRYITVNGRLLFALFAACDIPDCDVFIHTWQQLAEKEGLAGFHFVGLSATKEEIGKYGLAASTPHPPHFFLSQIPSGWVDKITYRLFGKSWNELKAKWFSLPKIIQYDAYVEANMKKRYKEYEYPGILPNWDHSTRSGKNAFILIDATPEKFGRIVEHAVKAVSEKPFEERIVFIKAWNEWAEGNFLEPEKKFGRGYLEIIKKNNS